MNKDDQDQSRWAKDRFLYLLVFCLILIAIQPLDEALGTAGIILSVVTSFVLLSAIYSVSQKWHRAALGGVLAVPTLVFVWSRHSFQYTWTDTIGILCGIAFFIFIVVTILSFISRQKEITRDVIAGSAVVYLLLAVAWSYAYRLCDMIQPGSFLTAHGQIDDFRMYSYYSFVTITTLGYGDVVPTTTLARSFAILEAVVGQLYLVVTVARLVGVHVGQYQRK